MLPHPFTALGPLAPAQGEAATDWFAAGLVLALVGGVLLANALVIQHPRRLVEERFGRRSPRLRSVRETVHQRLQVQLGFLFLLAGFGLQLYGHVRGGGDGRFPLLWVVAVVGAVVVVEVAGYWLSQWLVRRSIRAVFREEPPDLEADMQLARELGELFGIASAGDDTVQSYLARVRRAIGLPERGPAAPRLPRDDDSELHEPSEEVV